MTLLALPLQFHDYVMNTELFECRSDSALDVVRIGICHNMHGGFVVYSVNASEVDMVHIRYPFQGAETGANLLRIQALRGAVKEQLARLLQIPCGVPKDESCRADGQNGIEEGEIREVHHDGTEENHHPPKNIF